MKQPNIIAELSFDFAIQIIYLCRQLVEKKEFVLAKQLFRSATSIGANVEEASAAQSKRDFVVKMVISSKEARETRYWVRLLKESQTGNLDYNSYLAKIETIIKVLTKIVKTAQSPAPQPI